MRRVTTDPGHDVWPAWSPDGREIAFVASGRTAPGIYAVSIEGKDGKERVLALSSGTLGAPVWIPGAESVAFSALSNGVTRLMAGDREISANEDVFPLRPAWARAPGVQQPSLIYTADGHIKERAESGSGMVRVVPFQADLPIVRATYTPRARDFDSTSPRRALGIVRPGLSPDSERVVFAALGDIWIARRGEAPTRVTDDAHDDTDPAQTSSDPSRSDEDASRVPSGDRSWARRLTSVWRRDGRELSYISQEQALTAVDVRLGGVPEIGKASRLFDIRLGTDGFSCARQEYDVTADGQRFLVNVAARPQGSPITVVLDCRPPSKPNDDAGSRHTRRQTLRHDPRVAVARRPSCRRPGLVRKTSAARRSNVGRF